MATTDERIDPKDFDASLEVALTQLGKSDTRTTQQVTEWLYETAYRPTGGDIVYRRFAALAMWLESRPKWLIKAEGAEWEERGLSIASLKRSQRLMDAELNIVMPTAFDSSISSVLAGTSR